MCARLSTSVSHSEAVARSTQCFVASLVDRAHDGVVALAAVGAQAILVRHHFDGMIAPVGVKCGWAIGNHILIAKCLLNIVESGMDLVLIAACQRSCGSS